MNPSLTSAIRWISRLGVVLIAMGGRAVAGDQVAINARAFNGYARVRLADGKLKPERYAFAEGGCWSRGPGDKSIDGLGFRAIAETIAGPLRTHAYLSATDPAKTDLMILLFWGTTVGATDGNTMQAVSDGMRAMSWSSPRPDQASDSTANRLAAAASDEFTSALMLNQLENRIRDQANVANARILGYTEDYVRALERQEIGIHSLHDVVPELEADRYFVVLKAYDFRVAWKEKKLKLLWEARFSIAAHGNRFDQQLLAMTQAAARHLGEDTKGLLRQNLPEGKVEVGTPTVVEPGTKAPTK